MIIFKIYSFPLFYFSNDVFFVVRATKIKFFRIHNFKFGHQDAGMMTFVASISHLEH
jgi:hypothetical protein